METNDNHLRVGIYGSNGHQIQHRLQSHPHASLIATAAIGPDALPDTLRDDGRMRHYETLDQLLDDNEVELVSLCSPKRRDQAAQAIRCMQAGKHVYAEKPCAMTESELDQIIDTADQTGLQFHEMAGTAFEQPYLEMRKIVAAGTLGTIVQVLAQKSYPYHNTRPDDEDIDGGLLLQVGVHALRFIEHVAGVTIESIEARQTNLGDPRHGNLNMAASLIIQLENGGVAGVVLNYLNPRAFGNWGNETLRIFGTKGFVEAVDGGSRTRLVLNDRDCGELRPSDPSKDYFDMFAAALQGADAMPLTLQDELHPTRMLIRARSQ